MKILIVDDSSLVVERLHAMLERISNVNEIAIAGNYARGVELMKQVKPDIALLDIHLPDGNGIDLLRLIKEKYISTKVIMISNSATEVHKRLCSQLGANFFFDKSFELELLALIIAKIQLN